MENAAKAMQIAAGILMSVLVLGLLVYGYNNIAATKKTETQVIREGQAADFNKSFEAYNRELQGSELLALSNKVDDYNKNYPETDGYTKLTLTTDNISISLFPNYGNTSKTLSEIHKEVCNNIDIEAKKTQDGTDGKKYKYSELSKLNTSKLTNIGINRNILNTYETLVKEREDFARSKFECKNWEYDQYGRIHKITFKME